jgi:N-acetyldiaminopimelate deacetylase
MDPVELRHKLHQNPELMFEEHETTRILVEAISSLPGIKIHHPLETGLLIEYSINEKPYYLFRADIDALPIKEDTNYTFASKNDNMHACGHDVHSSILFGFLKYVVENKIDQNILFLFQPAEEGGGGATRIIESGILKKFDIKNAFALHITDEYEFGTIASTKGELFASSLEADLEIFGKSAHVAFPENGIHSFNALREFLDKVDKLLASKKEKIVFGYGKITSGEIRNIIPQYTRAECTIRTLDMEKSVRFFNELSEIMERIKLKTKINYKLSKGPLYSEVIVDEVLFNMYSKILSKDFNFIDCGYKMTGEDFGYFTKLYPSFMFWLGTNKGERFGLHSPKFLPDDSIIDVGVDIYKKILLADIY